MNNFLKTLFSFRLFVLVAILFGCGQEETGLNIDSITIEASSDVVNVGNQITLKATTKGAKDITELVEFFVNDVPLEGSSYTAVSAGDLIVHATHGSVKSNTLSISSIEEIMSITITSNRTTIKPIGTDFATITATNQNGADITSLMEYYIDGIRNSEGNLISATVIGEMEVSAKFEGLESNAIVIESELNVTSLTMMSSRATIPADSYTKAELNVLDQDQDDITPFISVYLDNNIHNEPAFFSSTPGTYQLKGAYENIESNVIEITANPFIERKVLIEEFTGEWCGWCPQAAYNLDQLVQEHPYVLTVGIHNGDGLEYENEALLRQAFGLNYFPSGLVGRVNLGSSVGYNGPTLSPIILGQVDQQIYESEVLAGVGINSTYTGTEASIDVSVYFYNDISDEVRITIYLIENDVISGVQQNYFSGLDGYEDAYYYSQPPSIPEYSHQYVLRGAATDILGEAIPQENVIKGETYSLNEQTISISGYNPDKCYIIAFAHYSLFGQKEIINAQQVKLGESIGINK